MRAATADCCLCLLGYWDTHFCPSVQLSRFPTISMQGTIPPNDCVSGVRGYEFNVHIMVPGLSCTDCSSARTALIDGTTFDDDIQHFSKWKLRFLLDHIEPYSQRLGCSADEINVPLDGRKFGGANSLLLELDRTFYLLSSFVADSASAYANRLR